MDDIDHARQSSLAYQRRRIRQRLPLDSDILMGERLPMGAVLAT